MVRSVILAAGLVVAAGTAQAAGLAACAINGTCGNAPGVYTQGNTVVVESTNVRRAQRSGSVLVCPYPHRPSDTVFIGGAGYLTKNQVRAQLGCRAR